MRIPYDETGKPLTKRGEDKTARAEVVWTYEEEPVRRLVSVEIKDHVLRRSFVVTGQQGAITRYFDWIRGGSG